MMTKEETRIHELEGQQNPFRVPEGYFENFNERLLARLPQQQQPRKVVRLMPRVWRYAAAIVVVLGVGSALYFNHKTTTPSYAYNEEAAQEEYYNQVLDYAMVDNMEIAAYLTEADY